MLSKLIFVTALLAAPASVAADQHRWQHYFNERFGTHADYPSDVFTHPFYAEIGDGVRLSARGGAELTIFGSWNVEEQTPKTYEAFLNESARRRYKAVTYREIKPNLLVLIGVDHGRIYYERYAFGDTSGAMHAMVVEYPVGMRSTFDPLVARMARSLGWASIRR